MTLAICTNCSNEKLGALTPCTKCRFDVGQDKLTQAKALLLCDHYASVDELREAAATVKAGDEVAYDQEKVDAFVQELEHVRVPTEAPRVPSLLVGADRDHGRTGCGGGLRVRVLGEVDAL